jgi:Mg-chelatase subunit ChlD
MTDEPMSQPSGAVAAPIERTTAIDPNERLRRWRLILGGNDADGIGITLGPVDVVRDRALGALYDRERSAGLQGSSPSVARWLGDIRTYFPTPVVQIMQRDALERLDLKRMLLEPELLSAVEPDVSLVSQLVALGRIMPEKTRDTARSVVRKVVDDLEKRLASQLRQAITGAINRSASVRRPRPADIDWDRTIRRNLKHYQPKYRTVIPETLLGHGRRQSAMRDIVIAVDESGSMAASIVYSSVLAAVMASLRSVDTKLVLFDTAVVDMTDELDDPVDLLFSTQLGGGTDINKAVGYCQGLITRPTDTIFVLISDLYEGGVEKELLQRVGTMQSSGVGIIVLLALSDRGTPSFDHELAGKLATMGVPAFACTPELVPDLMAAAIERRDIGRWASDQGLVTAHGNS